MHDNINGKNNRLVKSITNSMKRVDNGKLNV